MIPGFHQGLGVDLAAPGGHLGVLHPASLGVSYFLSDLCSSVRLLRLLAKEPEWRTDFCQAFHAGHSEVLKRQET